MANIARSYRAETAALCVVLLVGMSPARTEAPRRRPNFMLIVADDLGYSDLCSFGGEIATPNLDRLARSGLRFSAFCAAATCSPSRAMLLTGVDAHKAGLGNMAEDLAPDQVGHDEYLGYLSPRVATIAERLHDAGRATYVVGSSGHSAGDCRCMLGRCRLTGASYRTRAVSRFGAWR